MEIAKIYVNGTMATVSGFKKIPKGITGATITVTFGNDWSGLTKTAVFQGAVTKDVLDIENVITIPAECVEQSGHRLKVGFYGVADETLVIPTLWADLGTIQDATDPSGDASTDPELPVWAQMQEQIKKLGEVQASTARIAEIDLLADKWVGGANQYSQVVDVEGATENSQVDITPNVEQLVIFYEKDLTFVTENDGGVVTVYAIGQKPTNDYTIQATITEVTVRSGKIIGVTVGTALPKPNLLQNDPTKGDFVKGKEIIEKKLDAEKLPEAINTALAQAKKSGEFDGEKGESGYSIFYSAYDVKATVSASFHKQEIVSGDREVAVGDLVISSSGWLYQIDSITGTICSAKFLSVLAKDGVDGNSVFHLKTSYTEKKDTIVGAVCAPTNRELNVGDLCISSVGYLYEFTGYDQYGNLKIKYLAALATNGKNGKDGKDGVDGYTPVKGTDYFTEEDKQEMVSAVLASLPVYQGEVVSV